MSNNGLLVVELIEESLCVPAVNPTINIINSTVEGYVSWLVKENQLTMHKFYVFNVPAPVFKKETSKLSSRLLSCPHHHEARIEKVYKESPIRKESIKCC